jgi:alkylation response protein AidB-like acyl-CoA dehydrogenase
MDFSFSDEQQAVSELAQQILDDKATHEIVRGIEQGDGHRHDPDLWSTMAEAGLLGMGIPERFGGAGLSLMEVGAVLEQVGRKAAPVPALETLGLAVPAIAEFGSDALASSLLPGVVDGSKILTAALMDELAPVDAPSATAEAEGDGYRVTGAKVCVPSALLSDSILVSAGTGDGSVVVAVDPSADGCRLLPVETTAGTPDARVELDGVAVDADHVLGGSDPSAVLPWLLERATALQCVTMVGICEASVDITSTYITERKQFDVPIASFQAVGQRAADAYIDTEGVRLTAWQALWRLSEGRDASMEVAAAKIWAAEAGQRVVHAAVHLHGGVGVDRDYPLGRLFLAAKQLELQLGGTTAQLRQLGRLIAANA